MLLNKIVISAVIPSHRTRILSNQEITLVVGLIVNAIVKAADVTAQNKLYKELFRLFVSGEPSILISSHQEQIQMNFRPLSPETEEAQADTVRIFVSAVAAARKQVTPPHSRFVFDHSRRLFPLWI